VMYECSEAAIFAVLPASFRGKKSLSGEIALVTGAGSGIGRQISVRLARLGAKVVLWDISTDGAETTKQLIEKEGGTAVSYDCNVADRFSVYLTAEQVKQDVGNVSILVNNAGVVTGKRLLDALDEDIQKTMDVNITAHFWTIKAFLPDMLTNKHGHIVTISSLAGKTGHGQLVDYCASKFAAVGLHEALSQELRGSGIRLTNICPFFINTGMFDGLESRFPGIFPGLEEHNVADRIVRAIQLNEHQVVIPPAFRLLLVISALLPYGALDVLNGFFGFRNLMSTFIGRQQEQTRTMALPPIELRKELPARQTRESAQPDGTSEAA